MSSPLQTVMDFSAMFSPCRRNVEEILGFCKRKELTGFFNPIFWSVFRQCFLISGERESLRLLFKAVFVACGTLFSKSTNYFCPKENRVKNKSHKNAMNVPQPNKHCVVQQSRERCSSKYLAYQWYFSRTNIVDLDELKDVPFL